MNPGKGSRWYYSAGDISSYRVGIFVSIAAIARIITIGTDSGVLADPQHCDKPGSPSCYSIGHPVGKANPRTSCPSGHGTNFCDGWNAGARTESNNNNGLMYALDTPQ